MAWVGVRFKRTGVVSGLGSFPPEERTKLSKTFQGRDPGEFVSPRDAGKTGGLQNGKGALPFPH